jgi:hypothetical protein
VELILVRKSIGEIRNYPTTTSENLPLEIKKIYPVEWTRILGHRPTEKETEKERKRDRHNFRKKKIFKRFLLKQPNISRIIK